MLDGMTDALTQRNVTRSHLEHQVVASVALKSPPEYLYWCARTWASWYRRRGGC